MVVNLLVLLAITVTSQSDPSLQTLSQQLRDTQLHTAKLQSEQLKNRQTLENTLNAACLTDHPTGKISKSTLTLIEKVFQGNVSATDRHDSLPRFTTLDTRVDQKVDQSEIGEASDKFVQELCKEGALANRRCFAVGTKAANGMTLVDLLDANEDNNLEYSEYQDIYKLMDFNTDERVSSLEIAAFFKKIEYPLCKPHRKEVLKELQNHDLASITPLATHLSHHINAHSTLTPTTLLTNTTNATLSKICQNTGSLTHTPNSSLFSLLDTNKDGLISPFELKTIYREEFLPDLFGTEVNEALSCEERFEKDHRICSENLMEAVTGNEEEREGHQESGQCFEWAVRDLWSCTDLANHTLGKEEKVTVVEGGMVNQKAYAYETALAESLNCNATFATEYAKCNEALLSSIVQSNRGTPSGACFTEVVQKHWVCRDVLHAGKGQKKERITSDVTARWIYHNLDSICSPFNSQLIAKKDETEKEERIKIVMKMYQIFHPNRTQSDASTFFQTLDTDKNKGLSKKELETATAQPIYQICYENAIYDADEWLRASHKVSGGDVGLYEMVLRNKTSERGIVEGEVSQFYEGLGETEEDAVVWFKENELRLCEPYFQSIENSLSKVMKDQKARLTAMREAERQKKAKEEENRLIALGMKCDPKKDFDHTKLYSWQIIGLALALAVIAISFYFPYTNIQSQLGYEVEPQKKLEHNARQSSLILTTSIFIKLALSLLGPCTFLIDLLTICLPKYFSLLLFLIVLNFVPMITVLYYQCRKGVKRDLYYPEKSIYGIKVVMFVELVLEAATLLVVISLMQQRLASFVFLLVCSLIKMAISALTVHSLSSRLSLFLDGRMNRLSLEIYDQDSVSLANEDMHSSRSAFGSEVPLFVLSATPNSALMPVPTSQDYPVPSESPPMPALMMLPRKAYFTEMQQYPKLLEEHQFEIAKQNVRVQSLAGPLSAVVHPMPSLPPTMSLVKKNKWFQDRQVKMEFPEQIKRQVVIYKPKSKKDAFFNLGKYNYEPVEQQMYKKIITDKETGLATAVCTTDDCKTLIKDHKSITEAKNMLEIPHPNIARARDVFTKKDKVHSSFECCDPGTLADELEMIQARGKLLQEKTILHYFAQIVLALKEVSESGHTYEKLDPAKVQFKSIGQYGKILKLILTAREEPEWDDRTLGRLLYLMGTGQVASDADIEALEKGKLKKIQVDAGKESFESIFKEKDQEREAPVKLSRFFIQLLKLLLNKDKTPTMKEIMSNPLVKEAITLWTNSDLFQISFRETKENLVMLETDLLTNQPRILKAKITKKEIDREYRAYLMTVAARIYNQELPSTQPLVNRHRFLAQYIKLKVLEQDDDAQQQAIWLVRNRYDRNLYIMKEVFDAEMQNLKVLTQLKHLNIQGIKQTFKAGDNLIVVFEFCDADTLNMEIRHRCKTNQYFTETELLTQFSYLCIALKKIHDLGIVHRNLDSKSVLLQRSNAEIVPKLSGMESAVQCPPINEKAQTYGDKYIEEGQIGKGSFGTVYRVRRKRDKRLFAAKKIELFADPMIVKQTLQEHKIMKNLKHRNIVGYVESFFDEAEDMFVIVMECCEYGDFAKIIKRKKFLGQTFSEETILSALYQSCRALVLAEDWNIIHADIKPENMLLMEGGVLKLTDFGLSHVHSTSTEGAGTPAYVCPEHQGGIISHKSDVYSLGATIYELAALKKAFPQEDYIKLQVAILQEDPPALPPQYSAQLNAIVQSMMHKERDQRPTARQVCESEVVQRAIQMKFGIGGESHHDNSCLERPSDSRGGSLFGHHDVSGKSMDKVDTSLKQDYKKMKTVVEKKAGKDDDIFDLGVLLHEMAALSPSLSVIRKVREEGELPLPPKNRYSDEFIKFLFFLKKKPNMTLIINHPFLYPYYYSTGVEVARFNRDNDLDKFKFKGDLTEKVKDIQQKQMGQFRFMPAKEQEKLGISATHFDIKKKETPERPKDEHTEIREMMASASKPTLFRDSSVESMKSLSMQNINNVLLNAQRGAKKNNTSEQWSDPQYFS